MIWYFPQETNALGQSLRERFYNALLIPIYRNFMRMKWLPTVSINVKYTKIFRVFGLSVWISQSSHYASKKIGRLSWPFLFYICTKKTLWNVFKHDFKEILFFPRERGEDEYFHKKVYKFAIYRHFTISVKGPVFQVCAIRGGEDDATVYLRRKTTYIFILLLPDGKFYFIYVNSH